MSADPLTIHGLGADPNVYAYVSGQALKSVDPLGLCGDGEPCPVAGAPAADNPPEPSSERLAQERAQVVAKFKADVARLPDDVKQAAKEVATGAVKKTERGALLMMQGLAMTQGGVTMDPGVRLETVRNIEQAKPELRTGAEKVGGFMLEMTALSALGGRTFSPKIPVAQLEAPLLEVRPPTMSEGLEVADALAWELQAQLAPLRGGFNTKPAVVVGRFDLATTEAGAFASRAGAHAEDVAYGAFPGSSAKFSSPISVRANQGRGGYADVCTVCEGKYGQDAFAPGTTFKSNR